VEVLIICVLQYVVGVVAVRFLMQQRAVCTSIVVVVPGAVSL
jgi:hypothetical protein